MLPGYECYGRAALLWRIVVQQVVREQVCIKKCYDIWLLQQNGVFTSKFNWRREALDASEFRCVAGLQRHVHDGRGAIDIFTRKSAVFGPYFAALWRVVLLLVLICWRNVFIVVARLEVS